MTIEKNRNVESFQQKKHDIESLLNKQQNRMISIFSSELEQQFWQDREKRQTDVIVRAFVPATLFYFIFELISMPINYFTTEIAYRNHDIFMTMISYSTGWFALFCIYIMSKQPRFRPHYSKVVSTVICFGLAIVQIVLFSTLSMAMTWRGTLLIVLAQMFAYLCSGLRPIYTFGAALLAALFTCIALSFSTKEIPIWVLFNVMVLSNLVGLALATLSVSSERIRFLQSLIINLDKQISELLNQHLFTLSQQDTLTSLGNRRGLEQQLAQQIQQSKCLKQKIAILFIDVDYFKFFNDLYGHQNGDLALIRVAQSIQRFVGKGDVAVRYGGEEFVILLKDISQNDAEILAENIIQDIYSQKIQHSHSKVAEYLTLSIGITTYSGHEDVSSTDLLKVADFALYQAKKNGRNQCVYISIQDWESFKSTA